MMTLTERSPQMNIRRSFIRDNAKIVDLGCKYFLRKENLIWLSLSVKPAITFEGNSLTGRLNGWI